MRTPAVLLTLATVATAFPGLAPGGVKRGARAPTPGTPDRRAAAPPTSQYPYTGAKIDGLPGAGTGGIPVPAPGDTAHQFQHPPVGAYRGPWYLSSAMLTSVC
jgi:hypothetical protein